MEPNDVDGTTPVNDADATDNDASTAPVVNPGPDSTVDPPVPSDANQATSSSPIATTTVATTTLLSATETSVPPLPPTSPVQTMPLQQPSWKAEEAAFLRSVSSEGIAKEREHHDEKLERIMAFAKTKRSFTRKDVRLFFSLPTRTATTYLDELVAAGRLIRTGSGAGEKFKVVG